MAESDTAAADIQAPRPFESFLNLETGRQFGLMLGLAASVTLGVALAIWLVTEKDYKPLYDTLDRLDASTVVNVLESKQIDYRIDQRSGALLIDSARFHEARIALSAAGMPLDKNQGFELLDQEQPLGTSQFMESARYRRGLEGELARTISNIASVKAARVHLAVPKSTVFLRDAKDTRASVFVQAYGGMPLEKAQVRAIANLVASSVPELRLENVTVVDQRGNLLSDFDEDHEFVEAARQLDYQRQLENDMLERVNSLLEPILGAENYRAEVSADLDFTRIEQAAETYNPDYPAVRSEQLNEEGQSSDDAGGVPGVNSNVPQGENVEPEAGQTGSTRRSETRNYELDRTISYTQRPMGTIKRLSVAVAVADKMADVASESAGDAGGDASNATGWQDEELDRLARLVQNAVGYNSERGDSVTVVNTPFFRDIPEPIESYTPQLWEQPWFWKVVRGVLGALAFLLVIFMVLRPAMKRLTDNSRRIKELEVKHQQALEAVNEVAAGGEAKIDPDGTVHLTGASENLLPSPNDELDGQIDMVRNMIDDDPDRVAQVIQGGLKPMNEAVAESTDSAEFIPLQERAAILLLTVGEDSASKILQQLTPRQVQSIGTSMASLNDIRRDKISKVFQLFIEEISGSTGFGMATESYVRNMLVKALGKDKAAGVIDRILLQGDTLGLDSLKWMDARAISDIVRQEHPQIQAIVLAYLDSELSAEVMEFLPEDVRLDVMMRVAKLETVQPDALRELNSILENQFAGSSSAQKRRIGGPKVAADIMGNLEGSIETQLMEGLNEVDQELGTVIQDLMFVFANLIDVDDRGIQALLREVATDLLVVALKGADEELREKIFSNMSSRAADLLRDDLEALGPMKVSEVEAAQKEILVVARRMADAGEIVLGGSGEQML